MKELMAMPQNNIEKEPNNPTTFEALRAFGNKFGKSLKDSATAVILLLATFGYTEAQAQKSECSTQNIKLTQEQSIQIDHYKQAVDSLSDVLFEEAKKHNLLQIEKEAPETYKGEIDSLEHRYYKSRGYSFGNKNAIVMYESKQHISHQYPPTLDDSYEDDRKNICANGKLFVIDDRIFGISTYNNPEQIKENKFLQGNKSALYKENDYHGDYLTSNHNFTLVDFVRDAKNLQKSLEAEIALVRGMK